MRRFSGDVFAERIDDLAVEEPLQISCAWPGGEHDLAVTMRTPGHDPELAVGFMLGEALLDKAAKVRAVHVRDVNRVCVELQNAPSPDMLESLERNFYVSSSCGVCGKASIEAVRLQSGFQGGQDAFTVTPEVLNKLPDELMQRQAIFADTGSIHAAALFSGNGLQADVFEDVGRHNALDKLLGHCFLRGALPLAECGVFVSGRASFELVQKVHMAGVPMLVAVGAPSSLAVDFAWESDVTLVGFLREDRFNVYSAPKRVCDLS